MKLRNFDSIQWKTSGFHYRFFWECENSLKAWRVTVGLKFGAHMCLQESHSFPTNFWGNAGNLYFGKFDWSSENTELYFKYT